MGNLRERINLFYYNIFKFECFTQYLIAYPMYLIVKITGLGKVLAKRSVKENWNEYILSILNDPKGGISLHIAGIQVGILSMLLLLTLLNVVCGSLQIKSDTFWYYGMIVAAILAVVISSYAAPSNHKKYLNDFKKFESMSKAKKRKSALLTFLIVIGIWSVFIGSFIFYLRSLVH
ncbi:MAG: hypothetical protein ABR566_09610 [Pyrinomonadaceae bacterium]